MTEETKAADGASAGVSDSTQLLERTPEQAQAMAQVCLDMHAALGVRWGDDPYAKIQELKGLLSEMYELLLSRDVQFTGNLHGGIWTWPDRALAVSHSNAALTGAAKKPT